MKKWLKIAQAVVICACALLLVACGNTQKETNAKSASVQSQSKDADADSADDEFIGTWVLAVAKTEGLTITGDFSLFFQGSESITIDVKDDMTATMSFGKADVDFTWEAVDDTTITVVSSGEESDSTKDAEGVLGAYDTVNLTRKDDTLVMSLADESGEASTDLIFTSDGKLKGYEALTGDDASDISSSDELVGDWMLTGLSISTMTLYGSAEDLSELVGASTNTSMTIREDGTGTVMGSDFTWKTDGTSTTIQYDEGLSVTAKSLDGDIILDMTSMLGGEVVTVMRFTK